MPAYYLNEAAFDLPDADIVDTTVHTLSVGLDSGDAVGFAVARRPLGEDKPFRDFVDEHLTRERTGLRGYSSVHLRDVELSNASAIDCAAIWRGSDGSMVYQRQCHVPANGVWLILNATVAVAAREGCDAFFDHVLASLRLRE